MTRTWRAAGLQLLILALPAASANLMRGPYVQLGTPTSMVVRWRTDVATDSRVRYGTDPANLNLTASDAAAVTEHEVRLSGLASNTKYYYAVGSPAETLASGPEFFFVTSPLAGTSKPTRIWVPGDTRSADANELLVRDAYYRLAGSRHTDLWLMLGDNAGSTGSDAEFQTGMFGMFPEMLRKSVLWPTRGNHETFPSVYYGAFTLPQNAEAGGLASGSEAYYSFDYGNIHFVCLDSEGSDRTVGGSMLTWLGNDLAATNQAWIIVYWHHAPYSDGAHKSDTDTKMAEMRQRAAPILEERGVDLVLGGHSHDYERTFLIDGHYGTSSTFAAGMKKDGGSGRPPTVYNKTHSGPYPHEGAVYVVAGSSGLLGGGTLQYPAMYFSANEYGSLVLDIDGNTLEAKFLRETGEIRDYFTLIKGPKGTSVPPVITGPSPLVDAMASTPYAATFTASGDAPITWSVTGGSLPHGLTLHPTGVYTGTPATAGTYTFTVTATNPAGSSNSARAHLVSPLTQTPFRGEPVAVPGTIQAEDFDNGGEALAYHDTTATNEGGKYRSLAVDIEFGADGAAGYNVGWVRAGEWLEYTIEVSTAGAYTLEARVASAGSGGTFHVEFDGVNKTGTLTVPNTGGSQTWQTVSRTGLTLAAGRQVMRVAMDANGGTGAVGNFNLFRLVATPGTPAAPTGLTAAAVSNSQINLAWTDNSGNEDGFKIERGTNGNTFAQIAMLGPDVKTYQDTTVAANKRYYYRVRAYNTAGDSAYSNTANAKTPRK